MRIIEGVCMVGMYIYTESWINEKSTNEIRGRVFSLYALLLKAMIAAVSTGALQGSVYGLGPVYANAIGLDVEAVSWFMFMFLGGAVIGS